MREKIQHESLAGQEQEILNLLSSCAKTLTLLEQYDKEKLTIARNGKDRFVLDYETARKIINEVKKELIEKKETEKYSGRKTATNLKQC